MTAGFSYEEKKKKNVVLTVCLWFRNLFFKGVQNVRDREASDRVQVAATHSNRFRTYMLY